MPADDRTRWDQRYASGDYVASSPEWAPAWLPDIEPWLPARGCALDIAAGAGRASRWLSLRGFDVMAVDISQVGLALAREAVESDGLVLKTAVVDLETGPLPTGPFDLISCFHYWQPSLFPGIADRLARGGILVAEVFTVPNLERNERPSRRFLAEPGELKQACHPLEVLHYWEGWSCDQSLARVVARKPESQA